MQFTYSMTTVVQTYLMREFPRKLFHFQYIMQKLTNIHCLVTGQAFMLSFEQSRIIQTNKGYATCRRSYNVIVAFEHIIEAFRQGNRFLFEASISHRLATTCLVQRIVDLHSQM